MFLTEERLVSDSVLLNELLPSDIALFHEGSLRKLPALCTSWIVVVLVS